MSSIFNSLKSLAGSHITKNGARTDIRATSPPSEESDFNQWLHAMRLVASMPEGVPPEFRKKLWLSLAEKHLQSNKVDWPRTEKRCFSAFNREDDEELGNQIVKDLHRTGSSFFSGPDGSHNQAILKKVLIGYARYNEKVGYCQGFNMLGAFMLQVMERSEVDSLKVMIFLIEGVMPPKYFSGTLSGLITDMSVFRELLSSRLPKLSAHLDRLQGTDGEGYSFEPPLTNVFTMQWFLTLFCTCLPHATVLRIWDLIFLEGNEILLRTALMIWERFSERILSVKSADEFYSIMMILSKEMLECGFKDANTFIKKVVEFGPIENLQELRAKYNYNMKWTQSVQPSPRDRIKLFYSDDESYSDSEPNRMAVTAAYGWTSGQKSARKNSLGSLMMDPERLTMDINALKQQYLKLRERQRQAHLILTAACARQTVVPSISSPANPINHFLLGKSAILNSHDRRRRIGLGGVGPVPPARVAKLSMKASQGETLLWKDTDSKRRTLTRRDSIKWKDIPKTDSTNTNNNDINSKSVYGDDDLLAGSSENYNSYVQDLRGQSDSSSSYSEESSTSSTSTELCDEPNRLSDFDAEPLSVDDANENPVLDAKTSPKYDPLPEIKTSPICEEFPKTTCEFLRDPSEENINESTEIINSSLHNLSSELDSSKIYENIQESDFNYPRDLSQEHLEQASEVESCLSRVYESSLIRKPFFYRHDLSEENLSEKAEAIVAKSNITEEHNLVEINPIYQPESQFTCSDNLSTINLSGEFENKPTRITLDIEQSPEKCFTFLRNLSDEKLTLNLDLKSDSACESLSGTYLTKTSPTYEPSFPKHSPLYDDLLKNNLSRDLSEDSISRKDKFASNFDYLLTSENEVNVNSSEENLCERKNYVTEAAIENIAQTIQENKNLLSRVTEDRLKEKSQFDKNIAATEPESTNQDLEVSTSSSVTFDNQLTEKDEFLVNDTFLSSVDHSYFLTNRSLTESTSDQNFQFCVLCQESACTCSENTVQNTGKKHSERALQIIEENSKILHRISRYNIENTSALNFPHLTDFYSIKLGDNRNPSDLSDDQVGDASQNSICLSRSNSRYDLNFSKYVTTTEPRLTFKNYFIDKEKLSPIYRLNSEEKNIFNITNSANINDVVSDISFRKDCVSDSLPFDYKFHVIGDDAIPKDEKDSPKDKYVLDDNATKSEASTDSKSDKSRLTLTPDFDFVLRKDIQSRLSPITSTSISSEYRDNIRNPYSSVLSPSHLSNFRSILSMDNNFTSDSKSKSYNIQSPNEKSPNE